jgi:hypothetical protein
MLKRVDNSFDFGYEGLPVADAAIQTLAAQHADLDLHHVEPTRVFRCERPVICEGVGQAFCFGARLEPRS